MNEEKAREILKDATYYPSIGTNDLLSGAINWDVSESVEYIDLHGTFNLEQLQALAWWMENKNV